MQLKISFKDGNLTKTLETEVWSTDSLSRDLTLFFKEYFPDLIYVDFVEEDPEWANL